MNTIAADDLEVEVRNIADENPDFEYVAPVTSNVCVYFNEDGSPSCLIGQGLARLGADADYIIKYYNSEGVQDLFGIGIIEGTRSQADWFSEVQSNQDMGITWQNSVGLADQEESDDE